MRISTKGRGIIRAQQGAVARPNPKENYKLPEDQRYQAQTRGMKDFAIEWYKERAKLHNTFASNANNTRFDLSR